MSETKSEYVKRQKGNLHTWVEEIEKFQTRADRATDKLLDKLNAHISELKEKKSLLEDKVNEVEKTAEEGWHHLKTGTDKAFNELDKLFKSVKGHFN